MADFSPESLARLSTCHPDLQRLFKEVVKYYDCTVCVGHRGEDDQNKALLEGKSKLKWPESKHNSMPSRAVDIAPYPVDWDNQKAFYYFAGFVMNTARYLGIKIKWGGDWRGDQNFLNNKFSDLDHFELVD